MNPAVKKYPTPFYMYEGAIIRRDFMALQNALPAGFKILYSMKANPHPEVLACLRGLGAGADVASSGELHAALAAGFSPQDISFVGPGKSPSELHEIVERGIGGAVVESLAELEALLQIADGRPVHIVLRINPQHQTSHVGAASVNRPSHFGIDEELLPTALRFLKGKRFGLHFYIHSQFLEAAHLLKNFAQFFAIAERVQNLSGEPLSAVNLGGGFGIPYFSDQWELGLAALQEGLARLVQSASLKDARFFVESGRFLVGRSGTFVTRVLYRKQSGGKTFLVCDGGFAHHLAATGVGQFLRKNFPIFKVEPGASPASETVTLVGPSCYSLDILGEDIELQNPQPGDLIGIGCSGAYGASFSPMRFLSPRPAGEYFL